MTDLLDDRRVTDTLLPPGRIGFVGLAREALRSLETRSARPTVPFLVVAFGVAAIVMALGVARSSGDQTIAAIDELTPTEVVLLADPDPRPGGDGLPIDAAERVRVLPGVVAAGSLTRLDEIPATTAGTSSEVDVVATSPGLLDVATVEVATGRRFDGGHLSRGDTVAVLGIDAAADLGITTLDGDPEVIVGDAPFTVIGLLGPAAELPELDAAVIVPETTAAERFGVTVPAEVRIDVAVGEADRVARDALVAVGSGADDVIVSVPRDRADIRSSVAADADRLGTTLGLALGLLGGLAVVATVVGWLARRRDELALRRSFGARRGSIVGQVLIESLLTGVLGVAVGAAIGLVTVVVATSLAGWDASVDLLWVGVTAGAAVALVVLVAVVTAAVVVRGEPSRLLGAG